jgi:predicted alpha/beta-fold hydrolase
MRGADLRGGDFYHAGLTSDLAAVIRSPALARYRRIYVLGYSMGGHVTLRFLAEGAAPRVVAGAAVCPPVDLADTAARLDRPEAIVYRVDLLGGLKKLYRAVAARKPVPASMREVDRITSIRRWDDLVIAPRFGFDGIDDYYARASVGPILDRIRHPALVVTTRHDPIVMHEAVWPRLQRSTGVRTVFLEDGGHVGFRPGVDLGLGATGPIEGQLLGWLRSQGTETCTAAEAPLR